MRYNELLTIFEDWFSKNSFEKGVDFKELLDDILAENLISISEKEDSNNKSYYTYALSPDISRNGRFNYFSFLSIDEIVYDDKNEIISVNSTAYELC